MCTCTCKRGLWKCGTTQAIVSPPVPLADFELCRAAVRGKCIWDRWMKCNYQSWRSLHDGISPPPLPPSLPLPRGLHPRCSSPTTRYSQPPFTRSSSTLAHNLYYGRGAHIINLIKRSALKIVLLVRQLLTAVTFLSPLPPILRSSFLSLFRSLTLISSPSDPLSYQFLYHLFSLLLFVLFGRFALVILTLPIVTLRHVTWKFFSTISVNRTLRFRVFVPPCTVSNRSSAP